jgi:hypothetical protein
MESLFSDIPAGDGKTVTLFVYSAVLTETLKIRIRKISEDCV